MLANLCYRAKAAYVNVNCKRQLEVFFTLSSRWPNAFKCFTRYDKQ